MNIINKKINNSIKSFQLLYRTIKFLRLFISKVIAFFESKIIYTRLKNNIGEKNVVFIEPNVTHAEILPGFAHYFLLLGYNVHVIMRRKCANEDPFVNMDAENLHIYKSSYQATHLLYRCIENGFDLIVLMSSLVYAAPPYDFLQNHKYLYKTKLGTIAVLHNINEFTSVSMKILIQQSRIITLQPFSNFRNGYSVAPIYFTNVETHKKNSTTQFVVIGNFEESRRDYELLFEHIDMLLAMEIKNFSVTLIGEASNFKKLKKIYRFLHILGRLNFKDMYDQLKNSDFIIPLLNSNNQLHLKYGLIKTSGSRQLSLGFLTPCIIEKHFADCFGFTTSSAIVYEKPEFLNSLHKAIVMSSKEYNYYIENLKLQSEKIHNESLQNIKKLLKGLEDGFTREMSGREHC